MGKLIRANIPQKNRHFVMTLREVSVPLHRLNIDMTEDAFETPDVSSLDHVPGGERVPEIVKTDLRDLGRAYQLWKVIARLLSIQDPFPARCHDDGFRVRTFFNGLFENLP